MFQQILVPVDLTEKSRLAVDLAFELATKSKASVTLLHVIEIIEHITFDEMKGLYKRLETSAAAGLKELSERFDDQGVPVECVVSYGHRTPAVIEYAVNNKADLIIMASHRIDPDRVGHDWTTISYGVAILAPCAVLLVK
jgi:nucleotide-binding universal stress UspA family protein